MTIKDLPIIQTPLSTRSRNCLLRSGIKTVGELLTYSPEDLQKIRNLGNKSKDEIIEYIASVQSPEEKRRLSVPVISDIDGLRTWLKTDEGRHFFKEFLIANDITIDALEILPAKAYNLLRINKMSKLSELLFSTDETLSGLTLMDSSTLHEIHIASDQYVEELLPQLLQLVAEHTADTASVPLPDLLSNHSYRDRIQNYVEANDCSIEQLGLSFRSCNQLLKNGFTLLSQIVFMSENELSLLPALGKTSVKDIRSHVLTYLSAREDELRAVCNGDPIPEKEPVMPDDEEVRERILDTFAEIEFKGLSLSEMQEKLGLPEKYPVDCLKHIIGTLLAEGKLEYVDFRCHRVYPRFEELIETSSVLSEIDRDILLRRMQGETLDAIAQRYAITRERVRQIVQNRSRKLRNQHTSIKRKRFFDEDYYGYFYETYDFDRKDAVKWLGVPTTVFRYFDLFDIKQGTASLEEALEDRQLDAGLRLRVKNYLHRNKIYIDGRWIEKKRIQMEEFVASKICIEDTSFEDFAKLYNEFLAQQEILYDNNLYYTDEIIATRRNILSASRFLLWKQHGVIRYYDIDSRDYSELVEALQLDIYENVELSTLKFIETQPEIMRKYDIRDQYELHNLLRKIVPEGSYHDLHFSKMPIIRFGRFDRDAYILRIITEQSPISAKDLAVLLHEEFGYEDNVTLSNYLSAFDDYYFSGVFRTDQKMIPAENQALLRNALTGDFYFIDEVRKLYTSLFPDADAEEINHYSLKVMGYDVLSRYILLHYPSLDAYFEDILTGDELTDMTPIKKRFGMIQMFSQKYMQLKQALTIIEYEPNQIITMRRLQQFGVTKDQISAYINDIYRFTDDEEYFSIQSLRRNGFTSDIYELGFSDWFYANLLISDNRISYSSMFGTIIFYKGKKNITIQSFLTTLIRNHKKIDVYDLINELSVQYGSKPLERWDILEKIKRTEIYYDNILDRLYANAELYYREIDEAEGI